MEIHPGDEYIKTDEERTVVTAWRETKSMREIATLIGKTRGAVSGLLHRMRRRGIYLPEGMNVQAKEPAPPKEIIATDEVTRAVTPVRHHAKGTKPGRPKMYEPRADAPTPVAVEETPHTRATQPTASFGPTSLMDVTDKQCRYPITDDASSPGYYCGEQISPRRRYCPDHAVIIHGTATPRN